MKVALCLSGQKRTADKCFPSIQKNILEIYNPDVFFVTDENKEYDSVLGIGSSIWTVDDTVREYKPKIFSFSDDSRCINAATEIGYDYERMEKNKHNSCNLHRYTCALYRIYTAGLAANLTANLEGKYDCIIRCRFDLQLDAPLSIPENISGVYIPNGQDWIGGINDQLAWGDHDSMNIYQNLFLAVPTYYNHGVMIHPETMLKCHLETNKINVTRVDYPYGIVRT